VSSARGKLTIFFGAAPGVGTTFAMLEAARLEREDRRDVAVGAVETHGRYDTEALLLGLELLPRRADVQDAVGARELDLDAALARRPALLVVDELAHRNAPGARHARRWQDVEELLAAGIDVFTTLQVQHLESLVDLVARMTHAAPQETVPDRIFEEADHVRVVDVPIDELLVRVREGKVHVRGDAEGAKSTFFDEGSLIALRELALRLTAERVDAEMRRYREEHGIVRTWPATERLLVCVSPSPASGPLLRAARRLATRVRAPWIAAYVETSASLQLSSEERARASEHLRLAESLGAETVTLAAEHGPREIVRFARARSVTRVLVGKPTHARWRDRLRAPFMDELVRASGDIDVHVLSGEDATSASTWMPPAHAAARTQSRAAFLVAVFVVALATLASKTLFGPERLADVVMLYLLGVVLVSMRYGLAPSLVATALSVLCVDFVFVPPLYTLAVANLGHFATFGVMLLVAVVISGLAKRVRDQADASRDREMRTSSLYALSRALATAKTATDVVTAGAAHIHDYFGADVVVLGGDPPRAPLATGPWTFTPTEEEEQVAAWVGSHARPAGLGTDTFPRATSLFLVLASTERKLGVLGIRPRDASLGRNHDQRQHLDTMVGQIASALDRARLASEAEEAKIRIEREQLRNALLSSVSHDLRTPLAAITGTASTLLASPLDAAVRRELASSILDEADRLGRLVRNLLDMTRLEAGAAPVTKEWQSLEEAIGAALERTSAVLADRPVTTELAPELPLVPYDSLLLPQVLVNLLENAARYTPAGTPLEIRIEATDGEAEIVVADRGPGIPPGDEARVFDKFYRGERTRGGVGLGLTICSAIVAAHGGRIWVENRDGGGAAFHVVLPIEGEPPVMDLPEPREAIR